MNIQASDNNYNIIVEISSKGADKVSLQCTLCEFTECTICTVYTLSGECCIKNIKLNSLSSAQLKN